MSNEVIVADKSELLKQYENKQEIWLNRRWEWLNKAKKDSDFRTALWQKCKEDPVFFINFTSVAYNPNAGGLMPLILFDKQEKAIQFLNQVEQNRSYGTIVKSRYVGASVFSTAYLAHSLLFKRDWTGLVISRVLKLVDSSGDPDCLFRKVDLALDYVPDWMKPKLVRKIGLIQNPSMNSNIKGEGGDNAGRGGRATVVIVDEAAYIDRAQSVFTALSSTSQCCIFMSTPNGRNEFYRLASNKNIPSFIYHWRDDPRRDEEWYKKECAKFEPWVISQELDCSFNGSQENGLIDTYKLEGILPFKLESNTEEKVAGFDVAAGGKNNSVLAVREGRKLVEIFPLDKGLRITQQSIFIHNYLLENKIEKIIFDADGIGLGFKSALDDIHETLDFIPYEVLAFHGGKPASDRITPSGREAKEIYGNARSEAWHLVRDSINYTYDYLQGDIRESDFDENRAIQLLDSSPLFQDLGKPMQVQATSGKVLVESKISMKNRGLESPDYGDALAYCFYDGTSMNHDVSWLF